MIEDTIGAANILEVSPGDVNMLDLSRLRQKSATMIFLKQRKGLSYLQGDDPYCSCLSALTKK